MEDNNQNKYEGFSVSMALVDAIPVLFFSMSMMKIASKFKSVLFAIGASFSTLAGMGKVAWKMLLGLKKGDYQILNKMFVPLQASGFLLMISSLIVDRKKVNPKGLVKAVFSIPSIIFFALGGAAMGMMGKIAKSFDDSAKDNWKGQITNSIAQFFIFLGVFSIK